MIASRENIIAVPARRVRHGDRITLRPPPAHGGQLEGLLTCVRALIATP